MWTAYRLILTVTAFAVGVALPLAAQQPPGQQDVIKELQSKTVLADEDQAALRTWIDERIQLILAGDPTQSGRAARDLRRSHADGSGAFKEAYAAVSVELVQAAYQQAKRDTAARLIAVLNTLEEVSAYRLLIAALEDKRVPVRTAAVIGLRNLREELAQAGGDAFNNSTAALRDAGMREESSVTLGLVYRALDYTDIGSGSPDPEASAAAVLALLEARGERYGTANVKAEGADRPGLVLAGKLSGQLDEPGRRRLAIATAKMLRYAVTRYTSDLYKVRDKTSSPVQLALRNRMELFIAAAEELLAKLTPPPQQADFKTITTEMQARKEAEKATYMKIALNTWANLLQQRYQIDVHMEVSEDAGEQEGGADDEKPSP